MPETGETIYVYRYMDDLDEFVGPFVMEVTSVDEPYIRARRRDCEMAMNVTLYSDEGRWMPRQSGIMFWLSDGARKPSDAIPPKGPDPIDW